MNAHLREVVLPSSHVARSVSYTMHIYMMSLAVSVLNTILWHPTKTDVLQYDISRDTATSLCSKLTH